MWLPTDALMCFWTQSACGLCRLASEWVWSQSGLCRLFCASFASLLPCAGRTAGAGGDGLSPGGLQGICPLHQDPLSCAACL